MFGRKEKYLGDKKVMVKMSDLSTMTANLWDAYWKMRDNGWDASADHLYSIIENNRTTLEKKGFWS